MRPVEKKECRICGRYFSLREWHRGTRRLVCFTCHLLYGSKKKVRQALKLGFKTRPLIIKGNFYKR